MIGEASVRPNAIRLRPSTRWTQRVGIFAAVAALFTAPARVAAQEMEIPISVQIPLFFKVLSFDRQLHPRGHGEFVVGIAYQNGNRASVVARDEALRAIELAHEIVAGVPVRAVAIDLDRESLGDALRDRQISLLYVTPLRGVDVAAVAATAGTSGVTTASGVTRYIELGLAIGVRLQRDRPKILINLQGSRLQGADFAAELLKLAEVM